MRVEGSGGRDEVDVFGNPPSITGVAEDCLRRYPEWGIT